MGCSWVKTVLQSDCPRLDRSKAFVGGKGLEVMARWVEGVGPDSFCPALQSLHVNQVQDWLIFAYDVGG